MQSAHVRQEEQKVSKIIDILTHSDMLEHFVSPRMLLRFHSIERSHNGHFFIALTRLVNQNVLEVRKRRIKSLVRAHVAFYRRRR
jgi:hypothetical protein